MVHHPQQALPRVPCPHISVPHVNCFMVLFSNKSMLKIIITDIYKQNPHNSLHNNNFFEQNSQNNMHKNNFHKRNHETTCTTLSIKRDIDTTKHIMKAHASTSQVTQLLISRLRKRKEWDDIVALFQLLNKDQRRGQPARHLRGGAESPLSFPMSPSGSFWLWQCAKGMAVQANHLPFTLYQPCLSIY